MTLIREQDWPVQAPPPGFAQRAVGAMLQPVREIPEPLPHHPRRLLYWLLAALFVSGSALGFTWTHYHRKPLVARVTGIQPLPVPSSLKRAAPAFAAVRAPSVVTPIAKAKVGSTRTAKLKPKSPLPQPRTPACQCERGFADFICDCY